MADLISDGARSLHFLTSPNACVRYNAAQCLCHIARLHQKLEKEKVVKALEEALKDIDKSVAGSAEDALEDIEFFLGNPELD